MNEYLELAIKGDQSALMIAFVWGDTSQGNKYWARQYLRPEGISNHAKKLMRKMRK